MAGGKTTSFKTDPLGRWVMASNAASTDTLKFDLSGRVTEQVTKRGTTTYKLKATWDKRDRRTKLETLAPWTGKAVSYKYNTLTSRLDTLVDVAGGQTRLTWNTDGQVKQVAYPTSDTLTVQTPSTHRRGELKWSRAAFNAAFTTRYAQDSVGRTTARYFATSDTSRHYTYDGNGRLSRHEDRTQAQGSCTWSPEQGFVCNDQTYNVVGSKT